MSAPTREDRKREVLALLGSGVPRSYADLRRVAGSNLPIRELLDEGTVERLPLGMYGLPEREATWDTLRAFAQRYPSAVACLATAAAYHGLTTRNPHEIWAAFPYEQSIPRKSDLSCRGFRWKGLALSAGVETYDLAGVPVRMTGPARTVVDHLRTMNRTGETEAAMEALAAYKGRTADLLRIARELGAEKAVRPYLQAVQGLGEAAMTGNAGARAYELLRQEARRTGADVQALATSYAIERFMARLMSADGSGVITVKGGQSLGILFGNQMRPTRDLDINVDDAGIGDPDAWTRATVAAACGMDLPDGLSVDAEALTFEVREHQGDGGLRIGVPASVHTCRTHFVIDVGVGNEVTFDPSTVSVAGVLGGHRSGPPASDTRIYPHENTLAEKLVSKVEDGAASIRHKDFFDIWLCVEIMRRAGDLRLLVARGSEMTDGEAALAAEIRARLADGSLLEMPLRDPDGDCLDRLGLALSRTAAHRGTALPDDLAAFLMDEFGGDPAHSAQWANWCRNQKGRLRFQPPGSAEGRKEDALRVLIDDLAPFVGEVSRRAAAFGSNPSRGGPIG